MTSDSGPSYVTGGNGFVGTSLVKRLEAIGEQVESIGHNKILSTKLAPFRWFFFLSTYGNLYFQKSKTQSLIANVLHPVYILCELRNVPFSSFVYVSTSSVNLPVQTYYSKSKAISETIISHWEGCSDMPICIVRPYSITGVGEQQCHLIPTAIRAAFNRTPLYLDPSPTHDFVDVDDAVKGIVCVAKSGCRGTYELGSGKSISNLEVVRLVEKIIGRKIELICDYPKREYDNMNWRCSGKTPHGWKPKVSLEQSITQMIEQYERSSKKMR